MGDMTICGNCRCPENYGCDMYVKMRTYGDYMPIYVSACDDFVPKNPPCLRCGKESNGEQYGLRDGGDEAAMIKLGHPKKYYLCDKCSHGGSWYLGCLKYILEYNTNRLKRDEDGTS